MSYLTCVKAWLWLSGLASIAGWTLSAFGMLNKTGYIIFFGVVAVIAWLNRTKAPHHPFDFARFRRHFRRWLPLSFLVLCALVLLTGLLYAPSNYASLTYRTPRVLQWLTEEHWFWIHSLSHRLNTRACGWE